MRIRVSPLAALILSALAPAASYARSARFTATFEIIANAGMNQVAVPIVSVERTGIAEIDGGVVHIPAGAISGPVAALSDFGGTVVNGPATFSAGGAGAGSTCPLVETQEVCIGGGGFGGAMAVSGITQRGQALTRWGVGGNAIGMTESGVEREERGELWTQGPASAWFYIPEIDPATPFAIQEMGTFRGLPSTYSGSGPAGFSLVTPMVVTSELPGSEKNARALAKLRIDFRSQAVPVGNVVLLVGALGLLGATRLALQRRHV